MWRMASYDLKMSVEVRFILTYCFAFWNFNELFFTQYIVMFLIRVVTGQLSELVDTREFDSPMKSASAVNGKASQNGVHYSQITNNVDK